MEAAQILDKPTTNNRNDLEQTLVKAKRRTKLLRATAEVSRIISSILDPDELLARTVDIICDAYMFYYAGIFLIEEFSDGRRWAVLRAGRGRAGQLMMQHKHKLEVGGRSMVGACTSLNEARVAFDVGQEAVWFNNPFLPDTRSEMALPLAVGDEVTGALTVQSVEEAAFSDEDISSLQALADQLAVAINNARLHKQNTELLKQAARRAALLQAGARVSRNITSILDLDELLSNTVETICEEYDLYYAGIFLIDETPDEDGKIWAKLRAGSGEAGRIMIQKGHKLDVGGNSMIGAATGLNEARISLDVGEEKVWFNNPYLPKTRSEMALPLHIHRKVIGALTIQSVEEAAFSPEDISSLQIMADQLAVAINNARLLKDLERANNELVRTKTFESIATATGETIHWVGNKAAPIPACVNRIREDLSNFLHISKELLQQADATIQEIPVGQLLIETGGLIEERFPEVTARVDRLKKRPIRKLRRMLDIESVLEDLEIIENSGNTILQIKEDLIGPARRQRWKESDVVEIVKDNIRGMSLPKGVVSYSIEGEIPTVKVDPMQMGRVIINLVKNAIEAMDGQDDPHIFIAIRREDANFVVVDIADNGCGIPEEELTKIWLTFHTSKAKKGGDGARVTGLLANNGTHGR